MTLAQSTAQPPDITLSADALEHWRGELCLFKDLSVTTHRPVLRICGANGSGKTSLLKVLCFLSRPEHGTVTWRQNGQDLTEQEATAKVSFVGHRDGLNGVLTVTENLNWAAGLSRRHQFGAARYLQEQGLAHLGRRTVGALSAGQRRRVALLRSAVSHCPVWIWDEPYANLDEPGRLWANDLLRAHISGGGLLLMTTHLPPLLEPHLMQSLELEP